jgi:predicted nicotinamide N-methyase
LWPAARALARELLESPVVPGAALELGCGIGLPSLVLRHLGVAVVATDYYADALLFTLQNARRNRIEPPETQLLDWRAPPADLGRYSLVLAADVLYEERNARSLIELLPRIVAPSGRMLLADPGRSYLNAFLRGMREMGWNAEIRSERLEDAPAGKGMKVRVVLWEIAPPQGATPERSL